MATISEVSELDSGVASPETTPEGQDPLRKSSPSTSRASISDNSRHILSNSNSRKDRSSELLSSIDKEDKLTMLPPSTGNDSEAEEDDDENIDESIVERLWGLTEMFPTSVRAASSSFTQKSISFIKASYQFTRQVVWISVSTSLLLFAPVMFEIERFNVEEMVKQDRNRLVLGPGSAMAGSPSVPGLGSVPAR